MLLLQFLWGILVTNFSFEQQLYEMTVYFTMDLQHYQSLDCGNIIVHFVRGTIHIQPEFGFIIIG